MSRYRAYAAAQHEAEELRKKQKKKKRLITLIIVLLVVLLIAGTVITHLVIVPESFKHYITHPGHLAGVIFKPDETEPYVEGSRTVAVCHYEWTDALTGEKKSREFKVPYEELRFVTMFYKNSLEEQYGTGIWDDPVSAERHRPELEKLVTDNLNQNYAVLAACLKEGIDIEHESVSEYATGQLAQLEAECGSSKEYKTWLSEHWMSESYAQFFFEVAFLESSLHYALLEGGRYAYSEDNFNAFKDYVATSDDYVRTIQICIKNEEGESPAVNLARAKAISDELRAIDDPDERYAKMFSYIGSAENDDKNDVNGYGYYFTRYEMDETYEEVAFSLKDGEVSEAFSYGGMNFVIMRMERKPDQIDKIAGELLDSYQGMALGLYVDNVREVCKVTFNDFGRGIDLVEMR